jgi:hypothetical protein
MATQQEMEATRLLDGLDGRALQARGGGDTGGFLRSKVLRTLKDGKEWKKLRKKLEKWAGGYIGL